MDANPQQSQQPTQQPMAQQPVAQPSQQPSPQSVPQPVLQQPTQPGMNSQPPSSRSTFPKILLSIVGFLVVLGLILGAYVLGTKKANPTQQVMPTVRVTPTVVPTVLPSTQASSSSMFETLSAGGVYTFAKYMIGFPKDWQVNNASSAAGNIVTLTKNSYQLQISQAAFDAGSCSYPDKPLSSGIYQTFASFIAIADKDNTQYRRGKLSQSGLPGQDKYEVCAWSAKNNVYQEATPFGRIDYLTPTNADASILSEMDGIVASLKSE